jgi:hypothetical protein
MKEDSQRRGMGPEAAEGMGELFTFVARGLIDEAIKNEREK